VCSIEIEEHYMAVDEFAETAMRMHGLDMTFFELDKYILNFRIRYNELQDIINNCSLNA